jgi:hypothetical protein
MHSFWIASSDLSLVSMSVAGLGKLNTVCVLCANYMKEGSVCGSESYRLAVEQGVARLDHHGARPTTAVADIQQLRQLLCVEIRDGPVLDLALSHPVARFKTMAGGWLSLAWLDNTDKTWSEHSKIGH